MTMQSLDPACGTRISSSNNAANILKAMHAAIACLRQPSHTHSTSPHKNTANPNELQLARLTAAISRNVLQITLLDLIDHETSEHRLPQRHDAVHRPSFADVCLHNTQLQTTGCCHGNIDSYATATYPEKSISCFQFYKPVFAKNENRFLQATADGHRDSV
jgi:hypothetical protein